MASLMRCPRPECAPLRQTAAQRCRWWVGQEPAAALVVAASELWSPAEVAEAVHRLGSDPVRCCFTAPTSYPRALTPTPFTPPPLRRCPQEALASNMRSFPASQAMRALLMSPRCAAHTDGLAHAVVQRVRLASADLLEVLRAPGASRELRRASATQWPVSRRRLRQLADCAARGDGPTSRRAVQRWILDEHTTLALLYREAWMLLGRAAGKESSRHP